MFRKLLSLPRGFTLGDKVSHSQHGWFSGLTGNSLMTAEENKANFSTLDVSREG